MADTAVVRAGSGRLEARSEACSALPLKPKQDYLFNFSHLYVGSKKTKLIKTENRILADRSWGWGKRGDVDNWVPTSSYTMNKFWESNGQHGDYR